MLCDDVCAALAGSGGKNAGALTEEIRRCERFVLSPHVIETAHRLGEPDKVRAAAAHLFYPVEHLWLEWADMNFMPRATRHGMCITSAHEKTSRAANAMYFPSRHGAGGPEILTIPVHFDFTAWPIIAPHSGAHHLLADALASIDFPALSAFVGAAIALINTPRLTNRQIKIPNNKKIRSRNDKKPFPALQWIDIRLSVDKHETTGQQRHGSQHRNAAALHTVRAHLRLNSFGGVSLVRSHLRGNPEHGVRKKRYGVARIEDEGSEWKGGILPAPYPIKELSE